MNVLDIMEQPDGSGIVSVELSKEEVRDLVSYALQRMIQEAIEKGVVYEDETVSTLAVPNYGGTNDED